MKYEIQDLLVLGAFDAGASPNLLNQSLNWAALGTTYSNYMQASPFGPTVYQALIGFVQGRESGTCSTIVDIASPEGNSVCP
jgi:hypothetical protein